MRKAGNVFFSFLQVLVIAAILLFILFGLFRLGLLETPPFLDGFLGLSVSEDGTNVNHRLDTFLKNEAGVPLSSFEKRDLTAESVEELLTGLVPTERYCLDVQYSLYTGGKESTNRVLLRRDGEKDVCYRLQGTAVKEQLLCDGTVTTLNRLQGSRLRSVTYASGAFRPEEEVGTLFTHRDFLRYTRLDGYTFSLTDDDGRVYLNVVFENTVGDYVQKQEYKLDLDHGIVTEASCYEDGVLFYSLSASLLDSFAETGITLPAPYKEAEDALFGVSGEKENG